MTYRIEYYLGRLPMDVDLEDLNWYTEPLDSRVDYENWASVNEHVACLDMDHDGAITHRVVEVEPEPIDQWDARGLRFVKVESYRRVKVAS